MNKMKIKFNPALRVLLGTNALILLSAAMLGPIYALFVEGIGGDLLDASITFAIFSLAAGLTTLFAGNYADRMKEDKKLVAAGYLIMAIGFYLYNFVDSIMFLFVVQAINGFGGAIYSPAFDSLYSKHLDKKKEGTEWGMWEAMNYFTAAIGAVIGGYIVTTSGFGAMFTLMSLLCATSAIYLFIVPKKVMN